RPPKTIAYVNEKKQLMEQPVEYEWLPSKCTACDMLGHSISNCNKGKPIIWKRNQQGSKNNAAEQEVRNNEIPMDSVKDFEKNVTDSKNTGWNVRGLHNVEKQREVFDH
uniref:Uncharacterized protein n=1 Tax=Cannabis sativa TaxID=3483 RepID=A0A803QS59_CANSA